MQIDKIDVSLAYVTATLLQMTATKDGERVGRFRIEQTQHGTRVHTETGAALTLPHSRYTLASDIPGGKSATAGRSQCLRDVLEAAGLTGSQVTA